MAWAIREAVKPVHRPGRAAPRPLVAGIGAGVALLLLGGAAASQQGSYMDTGTLSVTVDLSVLDDGGMAPPGMAVPPGIGGRGRLLMPGRTAPVSRFHAPPGSGLADVPLPEPTPAKVAKRRLPAVKKPTPPPAKAETPKTPPKAPRTEVPASPAPPPPPPEKDVAAKSPPEEEAQPSASEAPPPPPPLPPSETAPKKPESVARTRSETTEPEQQAALPPATITPGTAFKVVFAPGASKMPASAKVPLRDLAAGLKGKKNLRLQLLAYAGGKSLSASKARHLSWRRALSVRSYLIKTGVRYNRIDMRSLGNKTTDEPLNRVDVVVVQR